MMKMEKKINYISKEERKEMAKEPIYIRRT